MKTSNGTFLRKTDPQSRCRVPKTTAPRIIIAEKKNLSIGLPSLNVSIVVAVLWMLNQADIERLKRINTQVVGIHSAAEG